VFPRGDKEADDSFFAECLDGLQTVQTIYQHKARAVRPNQDRRPLAVVRHTASTRFRSRVMRRFIGMSAIAKISRFIMIEGEDELTPWRHLKHKRGKLRADGTPLVRLRSRPRGSGKQRGAAPAAGSDATGLWE
jgi:hypothetical protein